MKVRLNITVDPVIAEHTKRYAEMHQTSVSKLVETYFRKLTEPRHKKNILELLQQLQKPNYQINGDLKDNYYKQNKKKYGS